MLSSDSSWNPSNFFLISSSSASVASSLLKFHQNPNTDNWEVAIKCCASNIAITYTKYLGLWFTPIISELDRRQQVANTNLWASFLPETASRILSSPHALASSNAACMRTIWFFNPWSSISMSSLIKCCCSFSRFRIPSCKRWPMGVINPPFEFSQIEQIMNPQD